MKKMTKSALLVGLGIGGALAYQKYNKPVRRQIDKLINKTVRKNDNKLEEMM